MGENQTPSSYLYSHASCPCSLTWNTANLCCIKMTWKTASHRVLTPICYAHFQGSDVVKIVQEELDSVVCNKANKSWFLLVTFHRTANGSLWHNEGVAQVFRFSCFLVLNKKSCRETLVEMLTSNKNNLKKMIIYLLSPQDVDGFIKYVTRFSVAALRVVECNI